MLTQFRLLVIFVICASLTIPLISIRSQAQNQQMTLTIGKPNIWSLAQAHYLLANVRNTNRSLKVASPGDLNPNSLNGARMEVLRTLLGIEAQISTPQALTNSVAQQQFQADFARKQAGISRLDDLSKEHLQVIREISDVDIALAALGPQPPEDKRDPDVEKKRTELTTQKAAKVVLRDAIAGQMTTASAQANATAALSNLGTAMPLGSPASLSLPTEGIGDIKDLVNKMLTNGMPDIDASQKLDNYIDMQYEVISKQLTLLRDETGPDERLVFLELPSSLYTVPKVDDNQMVKIDWSVSEYYSRCDHDGGGTSTEKRFPNFAKIESVLGSIDAANEYVDNFSTESSDGETTGQPPPITEEYLSRFNRLLRSEQFLDHVVEAIYFRFYKELETKPEGIEKESETTDYENRSANKSVQTTRIKRFEAGLPEGMLERVKAFKQLPEKEDISDFAKILEEHPELLYMGWIRVDRKTPKSEAETRVRRCNIFDDQPKQKVRVIDTVPRQSALSVNDVHATQKGFALTAKFLALFGFGAQVSYQRQRSIYEQFINQDVFGSGFGKGTDSFGWTFGPIPGTNRIAPGPRTTFAILAIPNDTWKINIQASAKAFPRSKSPTDTSAQAYWKSLTTASFDLLVPNENTEGFWIDAIDYSPVSKGERVTAIIKGDYFSPLTGILIDGIPLKRAVAIAKHESDSTTLPVAADSPGEYEYLNQNEIIISFKMADASFVGTPLITLVTPEKTSAINFFRDLRINHKYRGSLQYYSLIEPMFIDDLNLTRLEIESPNPQNIAVNSPITIRVFGKGFRRRAELCLNEQCLKDPPLVNSGLYRLNRFRKPASRVWTLTYRLGQKVVSTQFDTEIDGMRAQSPSIDSIENPATNRADGLTTGGYSVIIRGVNFQNVSTVLFGSNSGAIRQHHSNILIVDAPKGAEGGVAVLLQGTISGAGSKQVSNILDFVTPGKAIFKYTKPPEPKKETQPSPSPPSAKKPKKNTTHQ
ncbi:MAG TPA: IPT/TIG domain-containing protein [Pyrinomonadaceae bacterium]|nr:IPT/TIG domain-containing protein [Pyrinomonadaceae bacterium]